MQYRTFGRLDWKPSALGFGAMRLPILDDDRARIDEELATRMIRTAIDGGVNYVDTAWPYHRGEGEPFVGRCLQDGFRERIKLATKMPTWLIEEPSDYDRYLNDQLDRLRTDRIDFYLLHGLNQARWEKIRDLAVLDWAERAIADGRIGHIGFSFHDELAIFKEIVDAYEWTFCQIMYNYMDVAFQAGTEGLQYAARKGLAVVVMEPLRGGQLTRTPPDPVARLWAGASVERTQADWALQWIWSQPEVSLALSGMSAMQHVEENLGSADRSRIGLFTSEDLARIDEVRRAYQGLSPIPCTNCRYCMPCPNGVEIPRILAMYDDFKMYGDERRARMSYNQFMPAEGRADRCVECGQCEQACPQQIKIIRWLKQIHRTLAESTS
jgi:predicted aldo/keto reductase-like oxidoreductase